MPRVHEVAKELNLSSKEVLDHLERLGTPASSHSSSVEPEVVERLRQQMSADNSTPAADGPAATSEAGSASSTDVIKISSTPEAAPADKTTELPEGSVAVDAPPPDAAPTTPVRKAPVVKKRRKFLRGIMEIPVLIVFAFLIAVIIKTFLVQAFYIPSGSMIPTLRIGDRVLVEKVSYFVGEPGRGDVVVFAKSVFGAKRHPDVPWYRDAQNYVRELLGLPTGREEDYIKRIVAVGGDTIQYTGRPRKLIVNGERVKEPYINDGRDTSSSTLTSANCKDLKLDPAGEGCRIPAGKVFVMGDNRPNSEDSRVLGPIDEEKIVGRAFIIIWPPSDVGTL